MHLVEVGSHEFFSQSFIVSTYEGYAETREKSNGGLEDVVGIGGAVGTACLHLAQGGRAGDVGSCISVLGD